MTIAEYIELIECEACDGMGEVTDLNAHFSIDAGNFIADPITVPCEVCGGTGEKPCAA